MSYDVMWRHVDYLNDAFENTRHADALGEIERAVQPLAFSGLQPVPFSAMNLTPQECVDREG
jgi:hypothetical protein